MDSILINNSKLFPFIPKLFSNHKLIHTNEKQLIGDFPKQIIFEWGNWTREVKQKYNYKRIDEEEDR